MGVASLVLGIVSIVLGIVPLLPVGGPATLVLAAVGLPLGAVGLCLGLWSRSEAQLSQRSLGVHTAGLGTAVTGMLICVVWVGGLLYAQRKVHEAALRCRDNPQQCGSLRLPSLSLTPPAAATEK